jgi:hypothetical protein
MLVVFMLAGGVGAKLIEIFWRNFLNAEREETNEHFHADNKTTG